MKLGSQEMMAELFSQTEAAQRVEEAPKVDPADEGAARMLVEAFGIAQTAGEQGAAMEAIHSEFKRAREGAVHPTRALERLPQLEGQRGMERSRQRFQLVRDWDKSE